MAARPSSRPARPAKRQSQGFAPETLTPSTITKPVPPHLAQIDSVAITSIIDQTAELPAKFDLVVDFGEWKHAINRCEPDTCVHAVGFSGHPAVVRLASPLFDARRILRDHDI